MQPIKVNAILTNLQKLPNFYDTKVFAHYGDLNYMDVKMTIFHVFLRYKKINKIRSIEIIKKGFTYLKLS